MPNSFVTSRHFEVIAQRQCQKPLVTLRKLASNFNPFQRIGFLPDDDRNSLQKGHSVKTLSRKKRTQIQQVGLQMAAGDKSVGSRPSRHSLDAADGDHALRKFLERAKSGKLKGVEIRKSDPGTSDGRYLDSLREIAADPALSRKRKCDLLAVAQKKDRRHFGERACLHTIDHLLSTDQGQGDPIFFLSDDRDALNQCKEHFGHQVGCLNTKGLVGGFTENGLFEHVQMSWVNRHKKLIFR